MEDYKSIKIKNSARFILVIDEGFDKVYLKDLNQSKDRLSAIECNGILKLCFGSIKYIVNTIEMKAKFKEKEVIKKNIKIVK